MKKLSFSVIAASLFVVTVEVAMAQPQPWHDQIQSPSRFTVLAEFGNAAVLDRETGLVWERAPSVEVFPWATTGTTTANIHCAILNVGNRLGWRLPTIQELTSLVDPSQLQPSLPLGHPFLLTRAHNSGSFWSATSADPASQGPGTFAWYVQFVPVAIDLVISNGHKTGARFAWCVRGGQGVNPQ